MNQLKKTKESIEYDTALKNLHKLSLKKALSEEGIDTSKVPQQELDELRRILDSRGTVHQKYSDIINKAQQDSSEIINKAQQELKSELDAIQKEGEAIINSIKLEQGLIKPLLEERVESDPQAEPEKEEVREETGD